VGGKPDKKEKSLPSQRSGRAKLGRMIRSRTEGFEDGNRNPGIAERVLKKSRKKETEGQREIKIKEGGVK